MTSRPHSLCPQPAPSAAEGHRLIGRPAHPRSRCPQPALSAAEGHKLEGWGWA
jgi:hypothetical protein